MNADRELLELAAKAAGMIVWQGSWPQDEMLFAAPKNADPTGKVTGVEWDPLTDDGDALRLAVKLQLNVCNEHLTAGVAYCERGEITFEEVESGTADDTEVFPQDYAATRRAIVLAAAGIGKVMP